MASFKRFPPNDNLLLTGRSWDKVADILEKADSALPAKNAKASRRNPTNSTVIRGKNVTGATLDRWSVVGVVDSSFDSTQPGFDSSSLFNVDTPDLLAHDKFAITKQAMRDGATGEVIVSGFARVQVNVTNINHKYAKVIQGDSTGLASCYTQTEFAIRTALTQTGPQNVWVEISEMPQAVSYAGRNTAGTIAPGATGVVTLYDNGVSTGETLSATLDWPEGSASLALNSDVIVTYYKNEKLWRISRDESSTNPGGGTTEWYTLNFRSTVTPTPDTTVSPTGNVVVDFTNSIEEGSVSGVTFDGTNAIHFTSPGDYMVNYVVHCDDGTDGLGDFYSPGDPSFPNEVRHGTARFYLYDSTNLSTIESGAAYVAVDRFFKTSQTGTGMARVTVPSGGIDLQLKMAHTATTSTDDVPVRCFHATVHVMRFQ